MTVGTFDGFHIGHRHLVDTLRKLAADRGLTPVVVTFTKHPLSALRPQAVPPLLMDRDSATEWPDICVEKLDFTSRLAAMPSREFIRMLRERFDARLLVTGFNNRLGSDGPADIARYEAEGRDEGVSVVAATPLTLPDGIVPSSSAIRAALLGCRPELAALMLGRPYSLEGVSVPGRQNGRKLGFPTLNLSPSPDRLIPAVGVYAGLIDTPSEKGLPAVINIGHNPTVAEQGNLSIEGYAIDAKLPFTYGERIRFHFLRYLRSEQRFESLDVLRNAIAADIKAARP